MLEDLILSTTLKHHNVESPLVFLGTTNEQSDNHFMLLDEIFTRINGLERRLQVNEASCDVSRDSDDRLWQNWSQDGGVM